MSSFVMHLKNINACTIQSLILPEISIFNEMPESEYPKADFLPVY